MTSASTDRRLGLTGAAALKTPVKAATTANITLSGTQTIDGYAAVSGDRVLVQNQTTGADNGIYVCDSGTWTRDLDFDGSGDVVTGTMVYVINGTTNGNKFFQVTTTGTITIGTTSLAFSAVSIAFSSPPAGSITTAMLAANAVTYAKLQAAAAGNVVLANATAATANFAEVALAQNTLLGRGSTGNIAGITLGSGLSFSAAVLSAATGNVNSQFRLSLTTAVPVTTGDVTAAGTVFLIPYSGNGIQINGTVYSASQLSLALDSNSGHTGYHQSGKNFDLFAYISSGTTVAIGTGPAWTSDTARGTGAGTTEIAQTNGIYVNKNAVTLRIGTNSGDTVSVSANQATYIGTFRTTADGQTEDSFAKRFVWNYYNRLSRQMRVIEATTNWTYTTATWRQANAAAANQLDYVCGVSEGPVKAEVMGTGRNGGTAGANQFLVGVGVDSTSVNSAQKIFNSTNIAVGTNIICRAEYRGFPGIGRHALPWLEISTANNTTTWEGTAGNTVNAFNGITGEIDG